MKRALLLILGLVVIYPACCMGGELTLVRNGKSDYVICVPEEARPPEKFAAEELQKYVEKISGAKIPMAKGFDAKKKSILIGSICTKAGIDISKEGLESAEHQRAMKEPGEGFIIRTQDANLILAGIIPRSTLYAVYDFLERLGCRWVNENPEDEIVPSLKTIAIEPMDVRNSPPTDLMLLETEG